MNVVFELILSFLFITSGASVPNPNEVCFDSSGSHSSQDLYADPDNCHNFYQCFYHNETSASGILRNCPEGSFWSDKVLQCLPEDSTKPCADICSSESTSPASGCYADPSDNCASYFICANYASYHLCCPPNTRFNAETCSCVEDEQCQTPCKVTGPAVQTTVKASVQLGDGLCQDSFNQILAADPSNPNHFFFVDGEERVPNRCPANTVFDLSLCRCEFPAEPSPTNAAPSPNRQCHVYLPFDSDLEDHSFSKFETFSYGNLSIDTETSARGAGSLRLNGGSLEIPGLKSLDFGTEASWCFYYRCENCNGRTSGLLSNNKDASASAFSLIAATTSNSTADIHVGFKGHVVKANVTLELWTTTVEGFSQICIVVGGGNVSVYVDNLINNTVPVSESLNLKIAHTPFVIGADPKYGNFSGHIDEVLICDFALTPAEVNAHRAGKQTLAYVGLIPSSLAMTTPNYRDVPASSNSNGVCGHNQYWNAGDVSVNNRIIGGVETLANEMPWHVTIYRRNSDDSVRYCGGVVIDKSWVLTLGYCCNNSVPLANQTVFYGEDSARSLASMLAESTIQRKITRQIIHPNFSEDENGFPIDNFCLVQVDQPVSFDSWKVQPACLPPSCSDPSVCGPNDPLTIIGTGWTSDANSRNSGRLLKATVWLVEDAVCERSYNLTRGSLDDVQHNVCAGAYGVGGIDGCSGDGGSAGLCFKNGYFAVEGLTSFGYGCAEPRYPGMYSEVCHVVPWIKSYIS